MKLYGYWRSSCTWRVRIVMELKDVAYANVPIHLLRDGGEQRQQEHTSRNPMAQVPTLEWVQKGVTRHMSQSLAICLFLDRMWPKPPILPEDDIMAARAMELAEMVNAGIQPLQNLRVLQRLEEAGIDRQQWAREVMVHGFVAMETLAAQTAGDFLVGDTVTLADVCLVPQLYNARRLDLDLTPYPTLLRAESAANELEAFKDTVPREPETNYL